MVYIYLKDFVVLLVHASRVYSHYILCLHLIIKQSLLGHSYVCVTQIHKNWKEDRRVSDEEYEDITERVRRAIRGFEKLKEKIDCSRHTTQKLSTQKAMVSYQRKITKVEKRVMSDRVDIPKKLLPLLQSKNSISLFLGTHFSTKPTRDIDMYYRMRGLGEWYDPKNKKKVVDMLCRSCLWSAIPLLAFLAMTMVEKGLTHYIATIGGTLELEDIAKMRGIDLQILCGEKDIEKYNGSLCCLYKTKGSITATGNLLDTSNLVLDDCVTPVMKSYWERVVDEKPIVIVTGTSGKWDPVCVVESIKNALQKGVTVIYVNPNFRRTPIYTYAYVPPHNEGLVVKMDGEEFLIAILLLSGVRSSEILAKEGK